MINVLEDLVAKECKRQDISNLDLILAIIKVESDFVPKRVKFEPDFKYFYKVPEFAKIQGIDEISEEKLQGFSWGALQIMGGSARWVGYRGWLPDLCDPLIGVIWGLTYFKKVCTKHIYLNDQIASYNSYLPRKKPDGTYENQKYVDAVIKAMDWVKSHREKYLQLM